MSRASRLWVMHPWRSRAARAGKPPAARAMTAQIHLSLSDIKSIYPPSMAINTRRRARNISVGSGGGAPCSSPNQYRRPPHPGDIVSPACPHEDWNSWPRNHHAMGRAPALIYPRHGHRCQHWRDVMCHCPAAKVYRIVCMAMRRGIFFPTHDPLKSPPPFPPRPRNMTTSRAK